MDVEDHLGGWGYVFFGTLRLMRGCVRNGSGDLAMADFDSFKRLVEEVGMIDISDMTSMMLFGVCSRQDRMIED